MVKTIFTAKYLLRFFLVSRIGAWHGKSAGGVIHAPLHIVIRLFFASPFSGTAFFVRRRRKRENPIRALLFLRRTNGLFPHTFIFDFKKRKEK